MGSEKGLKKFLKSKMLTLLIILIFVIILFSIWAPFVGNTFFSIDTLLSIVDMLVVTSFLAIGSGTLLITGNLDLSVVAVGATGGLFMAVAMKTWGFSWPIALIATLALCAVLGLINALLVNEFNMQPFIATTGTASVYGAFRMWVTWDPVSNSPANISYTNGFTEFLGTYKIFDVIPFTVLIMVIAFIIYGIMLGKTKFGTSVYLVGGNPVAAKLSGLNPKRTSYILFANCSMLAGVTGIMSYVRTGLASQTALANNMYTGLMAAILGGISFGGGAGGMLGVFVGLLILNTFNKGLAIVNFDAYWSTLVTGILLVVALSLDFGRNRKLTKSLNKKGPNNPAKVAEKVGAGL